MHTKFWSENLKRTVHSEGLEVNRRIISEWILGKKGGKIWTGFV